VGRYKKIFHNDLEISTGSLDQNQKMYTVFELSSLMQMFWNRVETMETVLHCGSLMRKTVRPVANEQEDKRYKHLLIRLSPFRLSFLDSPQRKPACALARFTTLAQFLHDLAVLFAAEGVEDREDDAAR
jgi:hypothetical protein